MLLLVLTLNAAGKDGAGESSLGSHADVDEDHVNGDGDDDCDNGSADDHQGSCSSGCSCCGCCRR